MTANFYYMHGGKRFGPVSDSQLKQLLSSGHLRPVDLVWQDGMAAWLPAAQVRSLVPARPEAGAAAAPGAGVTPATSSPATSPAPLSTSAVAPTWSARPGLVRLLALVGGGGFAAGLVMGLLLGLLVGWLVFGGRGGPVGGPGASGKDTAQHPKELVGRWEGKPVLDHYILELKANGVFTYKLDSQNGFQNTGTWKVASIVEGKYKVHVVLDSAPDRTFGWAIAVVDNDQIILEGYHIGQANTPVRRMK